MRIFVFATAYLMIAACSKESTNPATTNNYNNNNTSSGTQTSTPVDAAGITVLINGNPMTVTTIDYNRSGSTFNFLARNSYQKLEVNCFHFYQQSGFNYMFSDSITYATRTDSSDAWNTMTAKPVYDTLEFNCCIAPLTDKVVKGDYGAGFSSGKDQLNVSGNFNLKF